MILSLLNKSTQTTVLHVNEQELAEICHLTELELRDLLEYDVIEPMDETSHPRLYSWDSVNQLKLANAVRIDYDLDLFTVVIIMDYQHKIKVLQEQVNALSMNGQSPD